MERGMGFLFEVPRKELLFFGLAPIPVSFYI
jgi:hypothetical protein